MSDNTHELLDHIVRRWVEKISSASTKSLEAILTRAENVHDALEELAPHGKMARRMLREQALLSQPMMSKLETVGKRTNLLRSKASNLPPSMSTLYILARLPEEIMRKAIEEDLRLKSRSELLILSSPTPGTARTERLLTISIEPGQGDEEKRQLFEEISAAVKIIGTSRGVELTISFARIPEGDRPYQTDTDQKKAA